MTEEEADRVARIAQLPHLEMEGIFTHFSCADQEDKTYCGMQLEKFERMCRYLEERKVENSHPPYLQLRRHYGI